MTGTGNNEQRPLSKLAWKHPLPVFFALAYLLSWFVFVPMIAFHAPVQFTILASFGPCAAALITHYLRMKNGRAFRLIGSLPRSAAAVCAGVVLTVLAYVVLPALVTAPPSKLHWSILISPTVYNYSTLLGGPLGEEFGWRGYALPRLEAQFGPTAGCAVLGIFWAGWHLPLFFAPGWTSSPFWIYVLIVISFSFIIGFVANLARFAVVPAILTHALFNTVSRFLNGLFQEVQPATAISFELILALGGVCVSLVLIFVTRRRLGYSQFQHAHEKGSELPTLL